MTNRRLGLCAALVMGAVGTAEAASDAPASSNGLDKIETIVVIYAENRSFDNLYGKFPARTAWRMQRPTWRGNWTATARLEGAAADLGGLTAQHFKPAVAEADTEHLPNAPFAIDDPKGLNTPVSAPTRDLVHRFYQTRCKSTAARTTALSPMAIPAPWSWSL